MDHCRNWGLSFSVSFTLLSGGNLPVSVRLSDNYHTFPTIPLNDPFWLREDSAGSIQYSRFFLVLTFICVSFD